VISERACRQCCVVKAMEAFSLAKNGPRGRHSFCKECRNARNGIANKLRRLDAGREKPNWPRDMGERILDVSINNWPALAPANDLFWRIGA